MNKIWMFSIAALILAFLSLRSSKPKVGLIVKTKTGGSIQGIISKSRDGRDFYSWLGIPYAEPPVGELRYASPKPAKPWDGIRDGSKKGSVCSQYISMFGLQEFKGTEDCLYLNVHAPKVEGEKSDLPVLVWIHGGAFDLGASDDIGPEYFMDEDVVFVGLNYRVGSFGFLSTGDEHIRGNMGLKDQAFALKWIQENIEAFGGDPKNVTIFGESAGGVSVHFQTLSPITRGLFHKAIAQSGAAGSGWSVNTVEDARATTLKFARKVGCNSEESAELVKCLRSKNTDELIQAAMYNMDNFCFFHPHKDGVNSRPCIEAVNDEEAFLTEHPLDIMAAGKAHRIPLMIGGNAHEGLITSMELYKDDEALAEFDSNWTANVGRLMGIPDTSKKAEEIMTKIRNYYTPNWSQLPKEVRLDAYTKMFTETTFICPIHHAISEQRKYSPVYPYYYNRRGGPSAAPIFMEMSGKRPLFVDIGLLLSKLLINKIFGWHLPDYGVSHGDELIVLGVLPPGLFTISKNDQDPDYIFSKQLVKLWVDFAKHGQYMEFRGAQFSATSKTGPVQYFEITDNPKTISAPFEESCKFLQSLNILKPSAL